MNLKSYLNEKFKNSIKTKAQEILFIKYIDEIVYYQEKSINNNNDNNFKSFVLLEKDIDKDNFEDKYKYWLLDNTTGLFFSNVSKWHIELRRALFFLYLVVNDKKIPENYKDYSVDYSSYYIVLNLGFYNTSAFTMGRRKTIVCGEKMNSFNFLRSFSYDIIDYPSEKEIKKELNL